MCGIVAEFDPTGVDRARFLEATRALRHRGPDGSGAWFSADGRFALGHTRLAIIDPGGSPQPIATDDGDFCVVVNGEFYDYEAARSQLAADGYDFVTGGDSEIALALYRKHNERFLQHLRGEFALIMYDGTRQLLLAARDRFGVKPLHRSFTGRRRLFASEARALFALGVDRRLAPHAFAQVARKQYLLPDQTYFRDVASVPPATVGRLRAGRYGESRYWDGPFAPADVPRIDDMAEAKTLLRTSLAEAVRLRLRADVPVAFHLSGGTDTASVVALAREHVARPVCYTVAFGEPPYGERREAEATAARLGAELRVWELDERTLLDALPDAVRMSEGLAINLHLPAKYLLARQIRADGYRVALSGEGADELLLGYAHLRQDANGDTPLSPSLLSRNAHLVGMHLPACDDDPELPRFRQILGFVPTWLRAKLGTCRLLQPLLRDRALCVSALETFRTSFDRDELSRLHPTEASALTWVRSALATSILRTLGDGTEMAHGVEGRLPFLDHVFAERVRDIAVSLKTDGIVGKRVLREAMRSTLGDAVCDREKMPFTAPPLSDAGLSLVRDMLRSDAARSQPIFDVAKCDAWVESLLGQGVEARRAADPAVMLVATTVALQASIMGV